MTQDEKQLLLQDFCARLPYKTHILYDMDKKFDGGLQCCLTSIDLEAEYQLKAHRVFDPIGIEEARPYLRPMSSMTEDEKREIYNWLVENNVDWFDFSKLRLDEILISFDSSWLLVNWLNTHHFDYRGLIPKGLAIEVTKDNNPYKE